MGAAPDAMDPHAAVHLELGQPFLPEGGDRDLVPARHEVAAQAPDVLLDTAKHGRVVIGDHQDAHAALPLPTPLTPDYDGTATTPRRAPSRTGAG